jgi:hypothetical protein
MPRHMMYPCDAQGQMKCDVYWEKREVIGNSTPHRGSRRSPGESKLHGMNRNGEERVGDEEADAEDKEWRDSRSLLTL